MLPVVGDFSFEATVSTRMNPAESVVTGAYAYQAGGIVIWSEDKGIVRLEAGHRRKRDGGSTDGYVHFEARLTNFSETRRGTDSDGKFDRKKPIKLRFSKSGNSLIAAFKPERILERDRSRSAHWRASSRWNARDKRIQHSGRGRILTGETSTSNTVDQRARVTRSIWGVVWIPRPRPVARRRDWPSNGGSQYQI